MLGNDAVFAVLVFALTCLLALATLLIVSVILWFRDGCPLLMPPRAEKLMGIGAWLVLVIFGLVVLMGVMAWGLEAKLAPKQEIEVTTYPVTANQWAMDTGTGDFKVIANIFRTLDHYGPGVYDVSVRALIDGEVRVVEKYTKVKPRVVLLLTHYHRATPITAVA